MVAVFFGGEPRDSEFAAVDAQPRNVHGFRRCGICNLNDLLKVFVGLRLARARVSLKNRSVPPGRRTVNTEPGPPKSSILPELCRTHLGLPDARAEFEPGIFVLLQCGALRSLAPPGMQSREHDPKRLQGPRYEMQHKRQRHFAFVLRRWLTWFYPQVCQNLALRERQSFCFVSLHLSPRTPEISDTTYLGC